MSHLSRITTKITDTKLLYKTLQDLGFTYKYKQKDKNHLIVEDSYMNKFELNWDGNKYLLIVDLELWNYHTNTEIVTDKIMQQYSYNSIIKTSIKEGFKNINRSITEDGSIRLVIQRWN